MVQNFSWWFWRSVEIWDCRNKKKYSRVRATSRLLCYVKVCHLGTGTIRCMTPIARVLFSCSIVLTSHFSLDFQSFPMLRNYLHSNRFLIFTTLTSVFLSLQTTKYCVNWLVIEAACSIKLIWPIYSWLLLGEKKSLKDKKSSLNHDLGFRLPTKNDSWKRSYMCSRRWGFLCLSTTGKGAHK